jgi:hypothetical protein
MITPTIKELRKYAAEDCEVSTRETFILAVADAWEADRAALASALEQLEQARTQFEYMRQWAQGWKDAYSLTPDQWQMSMKNMCNDGLSILPPAPEVKS